MLVRRRHLLQPVLLRRTEHLCTLFRLALKHLHGLERFVRGDRPHADAGWHFEDALIHEVIMRPLSSHERVPDARLA